MSSKLVFEFDTVEDLMRHVSNMADLEIMKRLIDRPDPKLDDNRGKHIYNLHEKAKKYHTEHPEVKYHQCMKIVSKLTEPPVDE